jgi:putative ABC transport system permease protein
VKFGDHISMCWHLVLRNRRRYKAVIAAIAFGTAGFIVVRTMGDSVEKNVGHHLELLGEATVMTAYWEDHESYHPGQFYARDIEKLKRIPHLIAVAPVVSVPQIDSIFRSTQWSPGLFGVDQSYWKTQTPLLENGRLIGPSDVVGRRKVCVVGQDVVKYLFNSSSPVGQSLNVGNTSFEVVGTLCGIQHSELRRGVFVPITTGQSMFRELGLIREIYLRADNWNEVNSARDKAMETLRASHPGYEEGIRVRHYPERVKKVTTTILMVKLFIYSSLVVAFLLGKVGLTSVMLAAVQDRTREIGLRKAIGASEDLIMFQFLTEAVFISVLAGSLGVLIGLGSVQSLKGPLGVEISGYVMSTSILMDLCFTIAIGIIAGLYPSRRAARLDVVDAMRFE